MADEAARLLRALGAVVPPGSGTGTSRAAKAPRVRWVAGRGGRSVHVRLGYGARVRICRYVWGCGFFVTNGPR